MADKKFNLTVVSAEEQLFVGEVVSIRVTGSEGELGVLAGHTALLTEIRPGMIEININDNEADRQILYISGGFLEVLDNNVYVLADTAIRSEQLDIDRILSAKKSAEEGLKGVHSDQEFNLLTAQLSAELAKLRVLEFTKQKLGR